MRSTLFVTLVALLLAPTSILAVSPPLTILSSEAAQNDDGSPGGIATAMPQIEVIATRPGGLTLELYLPALIVDEVQAEGRSFQSVSIPGGGTKGEVGQPEIPTFARLVSIPERSGVRITPTVTEEEDLTGYRLMPMQAEGGPGFAFDAAAYARNDFGAEPSAQRGHAAIMRDLRVVPLTFRPIRYNPAQGILKVARKIRLEVSFEGEDLENAMTEAPRPIPPSFDALYRGLVVNYSGPGQGRDIQPGSWVVICPNNTDVTSRLQPLVDWHKRKGIPSVLATTAETGTSNTSIKAWLQNAYDTWQIRPEYVCLAGDADGTYAIPTWFENLSGYSGCGDVLEIELLAQSGN